MLCPKCEIGRIENVTFKEKGTKGLLCNYCGSVWFEGETVRETSGHAITGFEEYDKEYTLEEIEENDPDDSDLMYAKFK